MGGGRVYGVGIANSSLRWANFGGRDRHKVPVWSRRAFAPHGVIRPMIRESPSTVVFPLSY